jgi:hypothetical protein
MVWKIYGERLDGFTNDDHPSEAKPGDRENLTQKGQKVDLQKNRHRWDLDFVGSPMPPPDAVKAGKVAPLSDEDRRMIVRWIDLGCPIDLDHDAKTNYGWMLDDQRPTLTVTYPQPGKNAELSRILIGMHDYGSGLNEKSLRVTADFAIDGVAAGENLAPKFVLKSQGVWEMNLTGPIGKLDRSTLTVSVADKQGNVTRIVRTISVGGKVP